MSKNKTLDQLRDENNGYNPESLDNHWLILNDLDDEIYIVRKDEFNGDKNKYEIWSRVHAETESEFIILYPKKYSLVYNKKFYVRAEDF